MPITVTIEETLYQEVRMMSAIRGPVESVIEEALRSHLRASRGLTSVSSEDLPPLPTHPGGPRPGISLHDNAALHDLLGDDFPSAFA